MSTGRVLWIIWCLMWAAGWFFTGLFTVVGIVVFWPLAVLSLLAILLPVGKQQAPVAPQSTCPACGAVGEPMLLPMHLQTAHGYGLPAGPQAPQQLGPAGPRPMVIEQQPYGQGPPVRPSYGPPSTPHHTLPPPSVGPPPRG